MVAAIPPSMALQDAFFAAGLGFMLCLFYSALRLLLGRSRPALAVCDILVLVLGAMMIRSAAISRFYSGLPRWYDVVSCAVSFCICRSALLPMLEKMRRIFLQVLTFPIRLAEKRFVRPLAEHCNARWRVYREKKKKMKMEKNERNQKKRLQNTGRVLYNSK